MRIILPLEIRMKEGKQKGDLGEIPQLHLPHQHTGISSEMGSKGSVHSWHLLQSGHCPLTQHWVMRFVGAENDCST